MEKETNTKSTTYDAQDVRQGEIILKKPWQRWLFGVGLFSGIVWVLLLGWFNS